MTSMPDIVAENIWLIIFIMLWVLPWKGVALWMAARRNHTMWFIAFLLLNTLAILPIVYIFFFGRRITVTSAFEPEGSRKK